MHGFPLHTLDTAPAEARPLLAGIVKRFGFLPNVYAHLAESPVALEALLQLSAMFERTTLSAPQRHLLLLTSSVENRCTFCVAAHTRGARAAGVAADSIESIRDGALPQRADDAALVRFVRAVIVGRGFVSSGELDSFYAHGFTPQQVLEVVLGVTLKILTNYANHVTGTELNPELAAFAWTAPRAA